jgi:hypothetical protein
VLYFIEREGPKISHPDVEMFHLGEVTAPHDEEIVRLVLGIEMHVLESENDHESLPF